MIHKGAVRYLASLTHGANLDLPLHIDAHSNQHADIHSLITQRITYEGL